MAGVLLTWRGRVADLVLAADDGPVGELRAERDALLSADGGQHEGALRDARDAAKQEDGRLQRAEEQARARKEEVAWKVRTHQLDLREPPDACRHLIWCAAARHLCQTQWSEPWQCRRACLMQLERPHSCYLVTPLILERDNSMGTPALAENPRCYWHGLATYLLHRRPQPQA